MVRSHDRALWPGHAQRAQQAQREGSLAGGTGAQQAQQQQLVEGQQAQQAGEGEPSSLAEDASSHPQRVIPVVRGEYLPPPDEEEFTVQASSGLGYVDC